MNDHGGKVWSEDGRRLPVLDFSASLWPSPMLPRVAFTRATIEVYPDPECRGLERVAADWYGVGPEQIFAANGSTEALYLAMRALRPAGVALEEPTFSEYARAAAWGLAPQPARIERHLTRVETGFRPGLKVPFAGGMAVLCNPNNPTGVLLRREELRDWLDACHRAGAPVLIDEAFLEFAEEGAAASLIPWLDRYPGLMILRSLTKCLGLAGLRVGFLLGHPEVLKKVRALRIPWSVNGPAQQSAQTLLTAGPAVNGLERLAQRTAVERAWLTRRLLQLGWTVLPSAANFLLCRLPQGQSNQELLQQLREQGVLLRDAATFAGLDQSWVRCAVRPRTDNRRLLHVLEHIPAAAEAACR